MKPEVVVLGSINVDFVAHVPHLPVVGETVQAQSFEVFPGGKGSNQAVAASRMGSQAVIVGGVGNDKYGKLMIHEFKREGINLNYLKVDPQVKTGISLIGVDSIGSNQIITYPGANKSITKEDIFSLGPLLQETKIATLHWDIDKEVGETFINFAREKNNKIILNLAPVRPIDHRVLKKVDILVVNEVEAAMLTGYQVSNLNQTRKACTALVDMGLNNIIITLGEKGVFLNIESEETHINAPGVEVVDPTAAGDTFIGTLASFWLKEGLVKAARLACLAASLSVTKKGALPSIPDKEELMNFKRITEKGLRR